MDPITPLTPAEAAQAAGEAAREHYLVRLLVAADVAANVALGGRPDETISTRAALDARKHRFLGATVSHFLDLFESDHGAKAAAGDRERAQGEAAALDACDILNPQTALPPAGTH